jgi:hypothetical protein
MTRTPANLGLACPGLSVSSGAVEHAGVACDIDVTHDADVRPDEDTPPDARNG